MEVIRRMGAIATEVEALETELDELALQLVADAPAPGKKKSPGKKKRPRKKARAAKKPAKKPAAAAGKRVPLHKRVLEVVEGVDREWSGRDLAEHLDAAQDQVGTVLSQLAKGGKVKRVAKGRYRRNARRASRSSGGSDDGEDAGPHRFLVPPTRGPRLTPVDPSKITRLPPSTEEQSRRKPSMITTLPLFGSSGRARNAFSGDYLFSRDTEKLPWPAQVELFRELLVLRRACWPELLASSRYAAPVLRHVATVRSEIRKKHSERVRVEVPAELLEQTKFVHRKAELAACVDWAAGLDPDGRALRSAWDGLRLAHEGAAVAWLPLPPGPQHAGWVARCGVAVARLDALRHRIATTNIGLAFKLASMRKGRGNFAFEDLLHEGFLGILTAVDRFDLERGFRFSTYATHWIRHSMDRTLVDRGRVVRAPVNLQDRWCTVVASRAVVGDDPAAIAEHSGLPILSVERVLRESAAMVGAASLDQPPWGRKHDAEEYPTLGSMLPDEVPSVEDLLSDESSADWVRDKLDCLRPIDRDVVERRFGMGREPQTLAEIGEAHGLSRERIRQLEARALGVLRAEVGVLSKRFGRPAATGSETAATPATPATPTPVETRPFPRRHDVLVPKVLEFMAGSPDDWLMPSEVAKALDVAPSDVRRAARSLALAGHLRTAPHRFRHLGGDDGLDQLVLEFLEQRPAQSFTSSDIGAHLGVRLFAVQDSARRLHLAGRAVLSNRRVALRPPEPAANDIRASA